MIIHHTLHGSLIIIAPEGRLDAHGSQIFQETADKLIQPQIHFVLIDFAAVPYLSSAGIRCMLKIAKQLQPLNGSLIGFHASDYVTEVIRVAGFSHILPLVPGRAEALDRLQPRLPRELQRELGIASEIAERNQATLRFLFQDETAKPTIDVMGDINNVLHSRITEKDMAAKPFFQSEFSIGCGAMGAEPQDYMPILGESIMIGGTLVWLPTDGYNTADFMIPREDSSLVTLQTGFNVCVRGGFQETVLFNSHREEGHSISEIYRLLFDLAKERRKDYHGAIGLAMVADVGEAFGCGVRYSPILPNKPTNGLTITAPENFNEWFDIDRVSRHRHNTALICGVGIDRTRDRFPFNAEYMDRTFYFNPSNTGATSEQLHNHAVFFSRLPFPEQPADLRTEINTVVENGDFVDMRHLLDQTTLTRALIGVAYIQDFCEDKQR